jgi:hypothetical protein
LAEDDRSSFAMYVYRTVPLGGPLPRLAVLTQNRIATRLAIRAHPYVCDRADCSVPRVLEALVQADAVTEALTSAVYRSRCRTANRIVSDGDWVKAGSTKEERLLASAFYAANGFARRQSMAARCSIRESVRLAASERGVEEAVACCIEIARLCGMAV